MATVGSGDPTPATGLPRTSAVTGTLTGQIFLVVLVARFVSLYSQARLRQGAPAPETAPPPADG
jgi:hypothetical protein